MLLSDFEPIFKAHFNKLCNIAHKIVRNKDAAKDIVQDVFLKVWDKEQKLESYSSIENYLRKATVNASINYLESRKKVIPLTAQVVSAQVDATDQASLRELEQHVFSAIEKLPPQCKAVFVLSRFEGLKYQQIADYLDISVKTVENHMGKALRDLREELKPFLTREFISTAIAIGISVLMPFLSIFLIISLVL